MSLSHLLRRALTRSLELAAPPNSCGAQASGAVQIELQSVEQVDCRPRTGAPISPSWAKSQAGPLCCAGRADAGAAAGVGSASDPGLGSSSGGATSVLSLVLAEVAWGWWASASVCARGCSAAGGGGGGRSARVATY